MRVFDSILRSEGCQIAAARLKNVLLRAYRTSARSSFRFCPHQVAHVSDLLAEQI